MNLVDFFGQFEFSRTAFVGAGGKTTAMFELANQLEGPVFVTTTTRIGVDEKELGDNWVEVNSTNDLHFLSFDELVGVTVFTGPQLDEIHMCGVSLEIAEELHKRSIDMGAVLLIEADGAKKKSLKAPLDFEPVIPEFVDVVVVSAGLDIIDNKLNDENIHRSEKFSELSGIKEGKPINLDSIIRVLSDKKGGLKCIPAESIRLLHLTHVDTVEKIADVKCKSREILKKYSGIILSDFNKHKNVDIKRVIQRTVGIVLAAGGASRAGQPKQLLDWFGETVIHKVVKTALSSDLSEIIVVTGDVHQEITDILADLDVKIINNTEWKSGISSSIRVGLNALQEDIGAAMFILADQPQIPAGLMNVILNDFECSQSFITHPVVNENPGNPVLFSKATFSDLRKLEGDTGGKQLFSVYEKRGVIWNDEKVLMDIDTEEDYFKLISLFKGE